MCLYTGTGLGTRQPYNTRVKMTSAYKMKFNMLWNTTRKRKFWLFFVTVVPIGNLLLSLDHLSIKLPLTPEKEPSRLSQPEEGSNLQITSHHFRVNLSKAENSAHRLDLTRSRPIDPALFRNVLASDKLDAEIDNLTVVSMVIY